MTDPVETKSGTKVDPKTGQAAAKDKKRKLSDLNAEEQGLGLLVVLLTQLTNGDDLSHDTEQGAEGLSKIETILAGILGIDEATFSQWRDDITGLDTKSAAATIDYSNFDFDGAKTVRNTIAEQGTQYSNMVAVTGHPLLDLIAKHESNGDYNIAYGGKHLNFTEMSLNEVRAWQKDYVAKGSPSSAAGRYQIIGPTLDGLIAEMGLSGNEKFSASLQDDMAFKLLNGRGLNKLLNGDPNMDAEKFMHNISKEWASLPKDMTGVSYYDGDGLNKAGKSESGTLAKDTLSAIDSTRAMIKDNFSADEGTKIVATIDHTLKVGLDS